MPETVVVAHRVLLRPKPHEVEFFRRCCDISRRVWNWALAEWNRQYEAGEKPNAFKLKKKFNAIKRTDPEWLDADGQPLVADVPCCSQVRPFFTLQAAWRNYFRDLGKQGGSRRPRFKKKGKCRESFYIDAKENLVVGKKLRVPNLGYVRMSRPLRFRGRILGVTISNTAGKWYASFTMEIPVSEWKRERTGEGIIGVDLGVKNALTLSTGETLEAPKPLARSLRRLAIRHRRLSRKIEAAKRNPGAPRSKRREKAALAVARTHAKVANIRKDFIHKTTTRLCRENSVVALEDLNVRGMVKNRHLARALSDVAFGEFRRQLEYKSERYGTTLVVADRWYPSSKLCSTCGWKNENLTLSHRTWTCPQCGTEHDRDVNAAVNLCKLAEALDTGAGLPYATGETGNVESHDPGGGEYRVGAVAGEQTV